MGAAGVPALAGWQAQGKKVSPLPLRQGDRGLPSSGPITPSEAARVARQTALQGEDVADMGPCKRPGSAGEGTETLAYRRAVPASRDQGQRSHCRHRGLSTADSVPFDRSASRTALLTARFDDPHPSSSQPKRRQSETSAVPGRRCRRKRGPENGVIARPGLGPVWERQARPCRGAHRNRAEERKRTLPQLSRYARAGQDQEPHDNPPWRRAQQTRGRWRCGSVASGTPRPQSVLPRG